MQDTSNKVPDPLQICQVPLNTNSTISSVFANQILDDKQLENWINLCDKMRVPFKSYTNDTLDNIEIKELS